VFRYFDASALVERYVEESESRDVGDRPAVSRPPSLARRLSPAVSRLPSLACRLSPAVSHL